MIGCLNVCGIARMPSLLLKDVPVDVYERLRHLADVHSAPIATEAVQQLCKLLDGSAPVQFPDPPFLTEEISAPYDLPLPEVTFCCEIVDVPMWQPDPPILLQEQ